MSARRRVLYVYYATYGMAGAYVASLCDALGAVPADFVMAVSAYYRFPAPRAGNVRVLPLFFRRTESVAENPWRQRIRGGRRLALRWVELVWAYARLLALVVRGRIDAVNLALNDDYWPTFLFALGVRLLGRALVVTAHDVVPHVGTGRGRVLWRRRALLRMARRVVVHGPHVAALLEELADVPPSRVLVHTFPSCDTRPILNAAALEQARAWLRARVPDGPLLVLAPGYVRRSKGFDLLVDEWLTGLADRRDVWLIVAGEAGAECRPDLARLAEAPNVTIVDERLSDEELQAALETSHVVVLPYRAYAHSSIHLNAFLSAERPVVASDIPLFVNEVPAGGGVLYPQGEPGALSRAILSLAAQPRAALAAMGRVCRTATEARLRRLPAELAGVYTAVFGGAAAHDVPAGGADARRPRVTPTELEPTEL